MSDVTTRRHSATARMSMMSGGVLLLRMTGPLSARTLAGFAADAIEAHGGEARGFVLDYRAGIIVATPDELGGMLTRMPAGSPMRRPGAFVGTTATVGVLQAHAERMAQSGLWRRVFLGVRPAHDWVCQIADML